jgi:exopolysaccharide production protein ExoZ
MPKLGGLQFLRAFAAIMVLIGHAIAEAEHYFAMSFGLNFIPWTRGVDIFFVISGFIITLSATRYLGRPIAFLKRRFMRVAPLYYLFTTLMVITILVFPDGPKDTKFDFGQILSSYGFFPYARPDGRIAPILSLGWTLNYEMFFYTLCAFSLLAGHATLTLCVGIISVVLLPTLIEFQTAPWLYWTNTIITEFIFGILLAKIYQQGWHTPKTPVAVSLFLIGLTLLIAMGSTDLPRFIAAGVPAVLIVAAGTLFCPPLFARWQILGNSSYALYLSHRFTLRIGTLLLVPVLPQSTLGFWAYVLSISLLSIGLAILVHLWVERPFLGEKQKQVFA